MSYYFATELQVARSASDKAPFVFENSTTLPIFLTTFLHVLIFTDLRDRSAVHVVPSQDHRTLAATTFSALLSGASSVAVNVVLAKAVAVKPSAAMEIRTVRIMGGNLSRLEMNSAAYVFA